MRQPPLSIECSGSGIGAAQAADAGTSGTCISTAVAVSVRSSYPRPNGYSILMKSFRSTRFSLRFLYSAPSGLTCLLMHEEFSQLI